MSPASVHCTVLPLFTYRRSLCTALSGASKGTINLSPSPPALSRCWHFNPSVITGLIRPHFRYVKSELYKLLLLAINFTESCSWMHAKISAQVKTGDRSKSRYATSGCSRWVRTIFRTYVNWSYKLSNVIISFVSWNWLFVAAHCFM